MQRFRLHASYVEIDDIEDTMALWNEFFII